MNSSPYFGLIFDLPILGSREVYALVRQMRLWTLRTSFVVKL